MTVPESFPRPDDCDPRSRCGPRSAFSRLARLGLLVAFSACGGDSGTEPTPDPRDEPELPSATGTVVGVITPSGGTLEAVTEEGVEVQLDFPPGAVRGPTEISLTPIVPADGAWFSVELAPAGIIFFEPVEVDVSLPPSIDPTDGALWVGPGWEDGVMVPSRQVGSVLTGALRFFGLDRGPHLLATGGGNTEDGPSGLAGPGSAAAWWEAAGPLFGQAYTAPVLSGGPASCGPLIQHQRDEFEALVLNGSSGALEVAVELALDIAGLLQRTAPCPGAEEWVATAMEIACTELGNAIATASGTPTTSRREFEEQVKGILTWMAQSAEVAPDCEALLSALDAVEEEAVQFRIWHAGVLDGLSTNDFETFADLKDAALTAHGLYGRAFTLGLQDAAETIYQSGFLQAVTGMRRVAYTLCREQGWHYPLSRLTSVGFFAGRDVVGQDPPRPAPPGPSVYADFTDPDIWADLQGCNSRLRLSTRVSSGGELAQLALGGGAGPGVPDSVGAVDAPTRGSLSLGGTLGAFRCWNDVAADQRVIVAFDGVDVDTLSRGEAEEYLQGGSIELDLADISGRAGTVPAEGTTGDLTLRRERLLCDSRLWGPTVSPVVHYELTWKNPTLEVEVDLPARVSPGDVVDVDVRVRVRDLLGEAGFFEAIDLVLSASGGTLEAVNGTTDGEGTFRTRLTVGGGASGSGSASSGAGNGPATQSAGNVGVTVAASSFEGATAEGEATAALAVPNPTFVRGNHGVVIRGTVFDTETMCSDGYNLSDLSNEANFSVSQNETAACPGSSATSSGQVSGEATTDDAGGVTSFSASGSTSADYTGPMGGDAFTSSYMEWFFEVPEQGATYQLSAQADGLDTCPATYSLYESDDRGARVEDIHRADGATVSGNESGQLPPGLYAFTVRGCSDPGSGSLQGEILFNGGPATSPPMATAGR